MPTNATTANEIVNYKGDAAGALGSPDGGNSGGTLLWGNSDASGVSEAYKTLAGHAFQKNKDAYDRKLKIMDQVYKDLESEQLQLDKMLPNDRDKVRNEYLKPLRDFLIKKRGDLTDPDDYLQYEKLLGDFKEAKKYADGRLIFIGSMDSDISMATDPEKRARMLEHRNKTYNQDMFDQVKPFQESLDWTKDIFTAPAPITGEKEDILGDKIITTKTAHTPLAEFTKDTWFNYTDSPNKSLSNQMDQYKKNFDSLPDDKKIDIVKQWNDKIKQANEDEGYKPGDLYYVPPIAEPKPVPIDDQGHTQLLVTATAPEIVRAQAILDNYKNIKATEEKISKVPSEIKKNNAEIEKTKMEAFWKKQEATILIPSQAAENYAQAAKAKSDAAKTNEEAQKIRSELKDKEAVGDFYINQMLQMYDPKKYDKLESGEKVGLSKTSKIVAFKDEKGEIKSALSDIELNTMGLRFNAGKDGISVVKPESVIYNFDNAQDPYFIATYKYKSGGIDKTETKIWRPNQALEGVIKGVVGENTAGAENSDYKTTMRRWKERTGKENVNGSVMTELEKNYWQPTKSMQQEANDVFK
jgi:hypothetical protein